MKPKFEELNMFIEIKEIMLIISNLKNTFHGN